MRLFRVFIAAFLAFLQLLITSCNTYVSTAVANSVIIIDPGHGGEDAGAVGVNGVLEKDLNLSIARMIRDELFERGYNAILTRDEDKLLYTEEENIKGIRKICDLRNRTKMFNSYENAIVVSIHMNAFSSSKYSGAQIYHSESESSRLLSERIRGSIKENLQSENNRSLKESNEIYILKNTSHPIALVECGFLSNPEECEKLSQKEYQKRLSFSIVCGIIKYIEET